MTFFGTARESLKGAAKRIPLPGSSGKSRGGEAKKKGAKRVETKSGHFARGINASSRGGGRQRRKETFFLPKRKLLTAGMALQPLQICYKAFSLRNWGYFSGQRVSFWKAGGRWTCSETEIIPPAPVGSQTIIVGRYDRNRFFLHSGFFPDRPVWSMLLFGKLQNTPTKLY